MDENIHTYIHTYIYSKKFIRLELMLIALPPEALVKYTGKLREKKVEKSYLETKYSRIKRGDREVCYSLFFINII